MPAKYWSGLRRHKLYKERGAVIPDYRATWIHTQGVGGSIPPGRTIIPYILRNRRTKPCKGLQNPGLKNIHLPRNTKHTILLGNILSNYPYSGKGFLISGSEVRFLQGVPFFYIEPVETLNLLFLVICSPSPQVRCVSSTRANFSTGKNRLSKRPDDRKDKETIDPGLCSEGGGTGRRARFRI